MNDYNNENNKQRTNNCNYNFDTHKTKKSIISEICETMSN